MKIIKLTLILIALVGFVSCSKKEDVKKESTQNQNTINNFQKNAIDLNELLESMAIVQNMSKKLNSDSVVLHLQFFIFEGIVSIPDSIIVNRKQYTDDGMGNDEVANDGIYTSFNSFYAEYSNMNYVHYSSRFDFVEELEDELYGLDIEITIGCDINLGDCPETSWYNSCWPQDSPCTCLEFSNCEASITFVW